MAKAPDAWNVLSHGPIERLAENLWRVEGTLPRMSLRRVMTIARRNDGQLVVHNGIALEETAMREIESFGNPGFLVVPNGYHRLDGPAYKNRYPSIRVFAPVGSKKRVEEVLTVDGTYAQFPADPLVELQPLAGVGGAEGIMIVRSSDGVTMVMNDAVFNMDRKRDPLGFLFTSLLGSAPGPRVSRLFKLAVVKDKAELRGELLRLAALPDLVRLVVAHEKVAHKGEAADALRKAATFL